MVLEGGKFKIFSALRAEEKRRSAPGILPPPLEKILATPLSVAYFANKKSQIFMDLKNVIKKMLHFNQNKHKKHSRHGKQKLV